MLHLCVFKCCIIKVWQVFMCSNFFIVCSSVFYLGVCVAWVELELNLYAYCSIKLVSTNLTIAQLFRLSLYWQQMSLWCRDWLFSRAPMIWQCRSCLFSAIVCFWVLLRAFAWSNSCFGILPGTARRLATSFIYQPSANWCSASPSGDCLVITLQLISGGWW